MTSTPRGRGPENTRQGGRQMGQFQPPQDRVPQDRIDPVQRRGSTVSQLKHDIDSGRTGDKVNYPDHAAAPLGTDDEAGGVSHSPEEIHEVRRAENTGPLDAPGTDSRGNPGGEATRDAGRASARWMVLVVACVAAAILVYLALSQ